MIFSLLRSVAVLLLQSFVWQGQKLCTRLALYFESILVNSLNKSDVYVYSFDESFNEITQTLEIGWCMHYWDVSNQVMVRYFESRFIGHAPDLNLFTHFNQIEKGVKCF